MDGSSAGVKQQCLETLPAARLRELAEAFGVTVADRRSKPALVAGLAAGETELAELLGALTLVELKRVIAALGLEKRGRSKGDLVEAVMAHVAESERPRPSSSAPPPMSARSAGLLKSSLRRFVIDTAGGFRGQDASVTFATQLLKAFGWETGHPPNAEIPATLSVAEHGQRTTRAVTMLWNERRVMLEVTKPDVMLDFAWKELLRSCLQIDPVPQYVVLTNQRDLHLYDLVRDRDKPRLAIALDDLPKCSEAFPFLSQQWVPGTVPTIINTGKVSREVADLVAKLYRSLKDKHPHREKDVAKFTLQCIIAMFAEDIGLLPQEYFTSILYEGARHRDVEKRLAALFKIMSEKEAGDARAVPFFNGGLFSDPVSLKLDDAQLQALIKAAAANWKYVDPHIFGSVFQGIMNDAERHAAGAHYTAQDDIMRVVGPTIVEPWRARIRAATTLKELVDLRAELFKFRVLDPACGSGNFLYVAFRELYRLDTEIIVRMREYKSTDAWAKQPGGIRATNFFGIDINYFAVELAKVTLNIAKKIAYEERKETLFELSAQAELEIDPSLPLDNLDDNIVCADALFTDWPEVDAIIGNPPFLGDRRMRRELGSDYIHKLKNESGADGVVDIACYFFRRAHNRLREGARAGLISTSGIRVGKTRKASLDYIVAKGATITNAVSSRAWPGESAVNVSMVNWVKGPAAGPHGLIVEDILYPVDRIATHLQLHADVSEATSLIRNEGRTSMGVIFGHEAFVSTSPGFPVPGSPGIRPMAGGDDPLRGKLATSPDYCIYLVESTEEAARTSARAAYDHVRKHVYPWLKKQAEDRDAAGVYPSWIRRWWKPWAPREDFFASIADRERTLVCPNVVSRPVFAFISTAFVPNPSLYVFAFDDDYTFGIMQSGLHWAWTKAKGSKVADRIKYTTPVWTSFSWPQAPSEAQVAAVAEAGRKLRRVRDTLMKENGWSLRALYQAAGVEGPHPLKDAQAALDGAVAEAYGLPADQDPMEFLLELNRYLAEDEEQGLTIQGPGLPKNLDPKDPRWTSDDCIEPPPLDEARS